MMGDGVHMYMYAQKWYKKQNNATEEGDAKNETKYYYYITTIS